MTEGKASRLTSTKAPVVKRRILGNGSTSGKPANTFSRAVGLEPQNQSPSTSHVLCPECGSRRVWKDGFRYTIFGEIQRHICRNCGYRFSHSEGSEPSEPLQKLHTLILKSGLDKPSNRNRHGDLGYPRNGALKSTTVPEPKIRRDPYNQYEAVNDMEARIQERAAGATKQSAEIQGKIIELEWSLQKQGRSQSTIDNYRQQLQLLANRGANLYDPESVRSVLATQEKWGTSAKLLAIAAYTAFANFTGIHWNPPNYKYERKLPFIPLEKELDVLISSCSRRIAAIAQLLKETGMRIGEATRLKWIDLDAEHNVITCNNPEKNSRPRAFKVSSQLISMLNALSKDNERIFGDIKPRVAANNFYKMRRSATLKLQNPRLNSVHLHTFRHWYATMEYNKTKDILHVMQRLGHKRIENTLLYTQLVQWESDQYHHATAKTLEEETSLIDAGFEFVRYRQDCDLALYRKRK